MTAGIEENYRDIILFTAINIKVKDNILYSILAALAIKALNHN